MIGTFNPTYSTNDIWRDEDMERCLTLDLEDIEADITSLTENKADVNHTHSGYASTSDLTQLQALVGDSSVSSQISAAMQNVNLTGYATEAYVNSQVSAMVDSAPEALNTLNELAAALGDNPNFATTITAQIGGKVDKVDGKGLSSNDYTASEKSKLAGITAEANKTIVDTTLSATSTNPVQNKIVTEQLNSLSSLIGNTSVSQQITTAIAGKADTAHTHSAANITSGTLPITRGGTGATTAAAALQALGLTATAAELNKLDGVTATTAELNYVDGVTSNIQTQLNAKAASDHTHAVDSTLSSSSTNPVQNKVINAALSDKRIYKNIASLGITTFPTTMKLVVEAMPDDSMLILDTRRINGADTANSTETISDWGNTTNGVALIFRGISEARTSMLILYGTAQCTDSNIIYGSYAYSTNKVNWNNLKGNLDNKVDKVKHLSGVDLNTVTTSGLYYVSSGTTALHFPTGSNGHMLVMSDGTRVRQVFFRVGTVDTNSFQWYSRHLGSDLTVGDNGWSKWWLLSGSESVWSGTAKLNAEINLGSRYGCQAWVVAGQVTNTDTYSTIYIPRQFLTTNQTKYKLQIADETGYISFYFYYKESDNNVYAKIVWVSDSNNSALRYAYRVS